VQGKGYDSDAGDGARIWDEHAIAEPQYGKPILMQPRIGQDAFRRLLVTDASYSVDSQRPL
jgi:hypothetical protein